MKATEVIAVRCIESVPPVPKATIRDTAKADAKQLEQGVGADALAYQQYAMNAYGLLLRCATAQPKESP